MRVGGDGNEAGRWRPPVREKSEPTFPGTLPQNALWLTDRWPRYPDTFLGKDTQTSPSVSSLTDLLIFSSTMTISNSNASCAMDDRSLADG